MAPLRAHASLGNAAGVAPGRPGTLRSPCRSDRVSLTGPRQPFRDGSVREPDGRRQKAVCRRSAPRPLRRTDERRRAGASPLRPIKQVEAPGRLPNGLQPRMLTVQFQQAEVQASQDMFGI